MFCVDSDITFPYCGQVMFLDLLDVIEKELKVDKKNNYTCHACQIIREHYSKTIGKTNDSYSLDVIGNVMVHTSKNNIDAKVTFEIKGYDAFKSIYNRFMKERILVPNIYLDTPGVCERIKKMENGCLVTKYQMIYPGDNASQLLSALMYLKDNYDLLLEEKKTGLKKIKAKRKL